MRKYAAIVGLVLLFILLIVSSTSAAPPAQEPDTGNSQERDEPLPPIGVAGIIPAPQADDTHFVVNSGPYLDRYLFRSDVPNGRLNFDIPITRYYSPLITPSNVDGNGFLKATVRQKLIDSRVLPTIARLRLHVFDVDEEVPAPYCPEVDLIYVNNQPIQAKLTGANQTWSSPSFVVPIDVLKFPTTLRSGGFPPQPVNNTISIDIDTQCFNLWAVEVDWAVLEIPTLIRPIIFAHGWVGDMQTFNAYEGFTITDGIPSAGQVDLRRGIEPIPNTSPLLARAIVEAAQKFGVDKINIFAHSKGGLVSRDALRNSGVAEKVDHLVTFGSPHHGTNWMDLAADVMCNLNFFPFSIEWNKCFTAARELKVDAIRDNFNYTGCTLIFPLGIWTGCKHREIPKPNVDYRTMVGAVSDVGIQSATYPWASDWVPYPILGHVDHAFLNPFISHINIHTNKEAYCRGLSYIAPNIKSPTCNGITPTGVIITDVSSAPIWPDNQFQTTSKTTGSLPIGSNTTLFATVDTVEQVLFNVFTTNELASFTLQNPGGGIITPATSGALYVAQQLDGSGWWYQYSINTSAAGTWQLRLNALNDTDYSSAVMVKSNTKLNVKTNKHTYSHNELVTVEAALVNNTTPLLGSTINLVVSRPDNSILNATLVDNRVIAR